MKATVDQAMCIGCSLCTSVCPQIFGMTAQAKAFAFIFPVPEELREACVEAAEQCPAVAITFEP